MRSLCRRYRGGIRRFLDTFLEDKIFQHFTFHEWNRGISGRLYLIFLRFRFSSLLFSSFPFDCMTIPNDFLVFLHSLITRFDTTLGLYIICIFSATIRRVFTHDKIIHRSSEYILVCITPISPVNILIMALNVTNPPSLSRVKTHTRPIISSQPARSA